VQVPGAGVQGVCRVGNAPPVHVMFGGADWMTSHISDVSLKASLNDLLKQHHDRPSRATAVVAIAQLVPGGSSSNGSAASTAGGCCNNTMQPGEGG
jgi:hypothetical protein